MADIIDIGLEIPRLSITVFKNQEQNASWSAEGVDGKVYYMNIFYFVGGHKAQPVY